jgi:hypothetical protein
MAKSCKKGYYYCNTSKKCKKIPKGYHVMSSGYLMRDNEHQDEKETEGKKKNGNGNGNYSNGNGNGNGSSSDGGGEGGGGGVSEAWSAKYKKSIDCDNPKGFSQKSHCRGREKVSEGKNGDHEVAMAQSQLKKSAENIRKLRKALGKKEKDIPAWMQAKITDTAHDTDAAAGYADKMDEQTVSEEGLRDWFGKSKSKDGKPGWVQSDGSPCANEPGEKGTPKCYSSAKKSSMSKKELRSADTRKSRQDPGQQQKSGAAKPTYVSTDKPKKKMKESYSNWKTELDEGVLGGLGIAAGAYGLYKAGKYLKRKGDEALDNARQNATINGKPFGAGARQRAIENAAGAKSGTLDPKMQRLRNSYEPEGEIVEEGKDRKGKGSGTKDACYHKVKSRYSVWPSAYASGALVKCRKVGAKNWGNKTKNESYEFSNWRDDFHATEVESIDLISNEPLQQSQGLGSDMLDEANSKQDKLKEISKQLAGASKMHAKQSKKVAKVAANLDEKCWKGYKKKGMKTMFGKRYPNCVKAHFSDWKSDMDLQEKKKKNCGCGKDPCKTYGKQEVKEDWQKSNRKDGVDGMSQKSVNAYKRENPGSKLQTAVTGKVKKGSKDANRRKNYCSRSKGQMKMHNIDCSKTPDKKICKARKRWRC